MQTKRLTIYDIAKATNVSYASVSRAISGRPGISQKTREYILETCEKLGYTANITARTLAGGQSKLIGFVVSGMDNPFMGELSSQAEIYAREKGYNLILCNSMAQNKHETELVSILINRKVDGVIIVPVNSNSYTALEKYLSQIPIVFIGDNLPEKTYTHVSVDNYLGAFIGTEYLVSLGHSSILYFGNRPQSFTHRNRSAGYIAACKKHKLQPAIIDNMSSTSSIENGYMLAKKNFSADMPYTAVFAATDTMAIGAIQAADEKKIRIPCDLSVLGFDNISISRLSRINLTTIEQPLDKLVISAIDLILQLVHDSEPERENIIIQPNLIIRGTCAIPQK
ncbi:MAG: LacI family transcriptional regulator [Spirochaetaceae bacterium]|jgi:LacI family transcriptional regulator|nr:LacI family transcriptional regulator [Spirochaetaceae bacterium]